MDIEKLIERLRNNNIENNCHDCALGYYAFEAATALSTLQIENQALRNSANGFKAENEKLRAELEQVTAERDAAIKDIWVPKWISCKNGENCAGCDDWEWSGQKED